MLKEVAAVLGNGFGLGNKGLGSWFWSDVGLKVFRMTWIWFLGFFLADYNPKSSRSRSR